MSRVSLFSITFAVLAAFLRCPGSAGAQQADLTALRAEIDVRVEEVTPKVVAWRRDFHAHPELGNREFRTAGIIADHLRSLGMEVETGVAHTGVVGLLRGGLPGPVVALRADMDALPVTEVVDLPFASKVTTEYNGQDVGVMHACGHDNHMAVLLGVAEVLAGMRERLPGTVKFIFQPAEEGAPAGEDGGASLMVREGVLENPRPDAIFGLHVWPQRTGTIGYHAGGAMASSQTLTIKVRGRQTHGAMPWGGVDPVVISAQIIMGLQTIISRQSNITQAPAVITVASIHGGLRSNIIPDSVVMLGTVRTLDLEMQKQIEERIRRTVAGIAESAGATAEVSLSEGLPITYNNPELTQRMVPTLERVAGQENAAQVPPATGAEDFSYFEQEIPGLYFFLGVIPDSVPLTEAAPNHSPYFFADEAALPLGVRALANLTVDFMAGQKEG
jgi:amidohydrolase